MYEIECRHCGQFAADSKKTENGNQNDCRNCNYRWFEPNKPSVVNRLLIFISFGLLGTDNFGKRSNYNC
jgi:DNA-directed RNA polymerase subunit RPC12/RpoP